MARANIRFVRHGKIVTLDDVEARTTVLDYVRLTERRTGTKEGCNEGDCGACTVVLADLVDDRIRYEPVNACIHLLPMLDGKALITVEDLGEGDALHPVQRAMVDHHGSQCGFCTPGFVLAMFALYRRKPARLDRPSVNRALAGNLCRCTGYRPIVDATFAACNAPAPDAFDEAEAQLRARLEELADDEGVRRMDASGLLAIPRTVDALADTYAAHPDATLVAGATDVGLWATKRLDRLPKTIFLHRVEALRTIDDRADALTLGAGVTHGEALPLLAKMHPDLEELWDRFAGSQVRSVGTIGGNIANGSPIGDSMPAFIALGATVTLRRGGETREIPLEALYVAYGRQAREPGEFVLSVNIPKLTANQAFRCYKVSKRREDDISAVLGAFRFDLAGERIASARIAYGGMAGTPSRAPSLEALLTGARATEISWEAIEAAVAADFDPLSDHRATAAYRLRVAASLARKALLDIAGGVRTRLDRREVPHAA